MTTTNRIPGTNVEDKEKYILANSDILALQGYTLTEFDDCLEDFIHNFLTVYNKTYKTVYQNNKKDQTRIGAHRSLIDIFLICKYYFPNCTLKEVIKGLYNLGIDNLCYQICNTINRRVYELVVTQSKLWQTQTTDSDEFGWQTSDYLTILNN